MKKMRVTITFEYETDVAFYNDGKATDAEMLAIDNDNFNNPAFLVDCFGDFDELFTLVSAKVEMI